MRTLLLLAVPAFLALGVSRMAKAEVHPPARDYSTQSARLVGRWASADPKFAAAECHYFGPIDKQTKTGMFVLYRLVADAKTGTLSWARFEHKYRILSETAATVITGILPDTESITKAHAVERNGVTSHEKITVAASHSELDGGNYTYIDGKDLPCSEDNARWKVENLASKSAAGVAEAERIMREGKELSARVLNKTEERRTAQQGTTSALARIISLDSRVTEKNNTWWRYAWKLTLRNDDTRVHLFDGNIEFQDADGFIIDTSAARDLVVSPNQEEVFTGFALITAEAASRVRRTIPKISILR